jgi:hypothetical protein
LQCRCKMILCSFILQQKSVQWVVFVGLPFVSFNLSSHFVQEMQKECLQSSPSPYDVYYPYLQWVSSIGILFIPGRLCKVQSYSPSVSPNRTSETCKLTAMICKVKRLKHNYCSEFYGVTHLLRHLTK